MICPTAPEDITGKNTHSDVQIVDNCLCQPCAKPRSHRRRGNHPSTYEPETDKYHEEEEYRKDQERMRQMALRVGVKVNIDVLQKLPIRLSGRAEIKTLNLIRLVIFRAIGSPAKAIHEGNCRDSFPDHGTTLMRNFDAELKKVLEVDFEDYNDNQKVLKHAIRKTTLEEIRPVIEEILQEARSKKLEKLFM